jgi:hypothetical protein
VSISLSARARCELVRLGTSNGAKVSSAGSGGEHPESLGAVYAGVSEVTLELGLVNKAEIVGSGSLVLQSHRKQGSVELRLDSVEPSSLGSG